MATDKTVYLASIEVREAEDKIRNLLKDLSSSIKLDIEGVDVDIIETTGCTDTMKRTSVMRVSIRCVL